MLKLVNDDVPSIEQFMSRYRVRSVAALLSRAADSDDGRPTQMDHPAALHRIQVGVPATVEHSSEAGPETAKWVAETTQVRTALPFFRHVDLTSNDRTSSPSWTR